MTGTPREPPRTGGDGTTGTDPPAETDAPTGTTARHRSGRRGRGQTTLDFTAGMSVFLIVLISVLLFIPGTLEPFTQGGQDDIVTANRIGDQLAEGTLGSPSEPHVLNATCTRFFFRGEDKSFCRYSGDTLQERLGVQDRRFVNITLRGDINGSKGEAILCWGEPTAGHPRLFERRVDPASCETRFAIGPNPTNNERSTVTARRVVTLNRSAGSSNKTAVALVVEVW